MLIHLGLYTKDQAKDKEVAREAGLLLRVGCKDIEAEEDMGLGQGPWKAVMGPKTGPSKDPGGGPDCRRPREPVKWCQPRASEGRAHNHWTPKATQGLVR